MIFGIFLPLHIYNTLSSIKQNNENTFIKCKSLKKMNHCKNKFLSPKYSPKSSNYDEILLLTI
jgi:hypothetical protein